MSTYFECGIRYEKTLENGAQKKVNEMYIVDALSFTEAEARIIQEITPYISGEFSVSTIKRTTINEVVLDKFGLQSAADADVQKLLGMNSRATGDADKWYKAKLNYIVVDEKTGKEKRTPVFLLVNAGSNHVAHDLVIEHMKGSVSDYEIADIIETKILDAFFYDDARLQKEKKCREDVRKIIGNKNLKKNTKNFQDSIPKGVKVQIVHEGEETDLVDKSDKITRR